VGLRPEEEEGADMWGRAVCGWRKKNVPLQGLRDTGPGLKGDLGRNGSPWPFIHFSYFFHFSFLFFFDFCLKTFAKTSDLIQANFCKL
jgi:hypothetical protein